VQPDPEGHEEEELEVAAEGPGPVHAAVLHVLPPGNEVAHQEHVGPPVIGACLVQLVEAEPDGTISEARAYKPPEEKDEVVERK